MPWPFLSYHKQNKNDCVHEHNDSIAKINSLEVNSLSISYPGDFKAVDQVCFSTLSGTRTAITGHNGSGKSSVIKAIAGIVKHQEGQIKVAGHERSNCHQKIAYLAQRSDIDWQFPLLVKDLLMQGRFVHLGWLKRPRKQDWAAVEAMAEKMEISDLLERQIDELSGGQQQRALLCRALIQEADILLLDEPFNGLDPESREQFYAIFRDLAIEGKCLLIATHDLDRIDYHFDQRIELTRGKISKLEVFRTTKEEIEKSGCASCH